MHDQESWLHYWLGSITTDVANIDEDEMQSNKGRIGTVRVTSQKQKY